MRVTGKKPSSKIVNRGLMEISIFEMDNFDKAIVWLEKRIQFERAEDLRLNENGFVERSNVLSHD